MAIINKIRRGYLFQKYSISVIEQTIEKGAEFRALSLSVVYFLWIEVVVRKPFPRELLPLCAGNSVVAVGVY